MKRGEKGILGTSTWITKGGMRTGEVILAGTVGEIVAEIDSTWLNVRFGVYGQGAICIAVKRNDLRPLYPVVLQAAKHKKDHNDHKDKPDAAVEAVPEAVARSPRTADPAQKDQDQNDDQDGAEHQ